MLEALDDPHTSYLDRSAVEGQQSRGYVGIGVTLSAGNQRGTPVVRELIPGGSAERAGLRAGDRILAVDGRSTGAATLDETARAIRGVDGTEVVLSIESVGESQPREMRLTRAAVNLPPVQTDEYDGVGHVRIRAFQAGVADSVRAALESFAQRGTSGWIIDLRGNRGGDIEEVLNVASLFVGDRTVGVQVDRSRRQAPMHGDRLPLAPQPPSVVLVDGDTGSGAEVLAAALKEYGLATIMGTKTAGKVGLATVRQLRDGSAVQLTYRRILSPSGAPLDGAGVEPNVVVPAGIEDWVQGRDPQLESAIARLHNAGAQAS
jgi:carboxyl-terminal processing protease